MTSGRDGTTCEFTIENDVLINIKKQNLKINWLEHFWTSNDEIRCILGFHSSYFVIHGIENGVNIAQVECGGSHRSWDFNGKDFAFTKDKQLMIAKGKGFFKIFLTKLIQNFKFY